LSSLIRRSCNYFQDKNKLIPFWLDWRAAFDPRLYPTIWRLRLLLSSRVWNQDLDAAVWEDETGHIMGFSMLWRRKSSSPYIVLDNFIHPSFPTKKIYLEMLDWGSLRVDEISAGQRKSLTLYTSDYSRSSSAGKCLEQNGYSPLVPNPEEHNVYLARIIRNKVDLKSLPQGYSFNKLREMSDLESYQSLYGFAYVNPLHRKELMESDEYCHLVVEGCDKEFYAYCECSICRDEWKRTNQRIGWVDYIETKPEAQQQGFGKAVLTAGLSRLQKLGSQVAMLVTLSTNTPALQLFKNAGFEPVELSEPPVYEKQISFRVDG